MGPNMGIETNTNYNLLSIQSLHFRIGVQLVKVCHSQCQIGISKQFNSLSNTDVQYINIFLNSSFNKQARELMSCINQSLIFYICSHDDSRWIQIVI